MSAVEGGGCLEGLDGGGGGRGRAEGVVGEGGWGGGGFVMVMVVGWEVCWFGLGNG